MQILMAVSFITIAVITGIFTVIKSDNKKASAMLGLMSASNFIAAVINIATLI